MRIIMACCRGNPIDYDSSAATEAVRQAGNALVSSLSLMWPKVANKTQATTTITTNYSKVIALRLTFSAVVHFGFHFIYHAPIEQVPSGYIYIRVFVSRGKLGLCFRLFEFVVYKKQCTPNKILAYERRMDHLAHL